MSRKSQETIGPNVDIPATTEFDASSLSLQQVSVRGEPIRFSTSSSHPAHFLRRTQSQPPSHISTVKKRRRHALLGCSLPVAPYVARVPMRMAGATGLEPAASCVTGRRSNQLNYAPAYDSRLIPSDSLSFPPVPSGRGVTGQRSPDASQILCSESSSSLNVFPSRFNPTSTPRFHPQNTVDAKPLRAALYQSVSLIRARDYKDRRISIFADFDSM